MRPLDVLRDATRDLHDQIDHSDFAHSVMDASIPVDRYASFLRAVQIVLIGLEEVVERSGSAALRDASAHGIERRARLERDLVALQADPRHVDAAALHATVLSQQIRRDAQRGLASLFGAQYVIEGSQLGGLAQKKALEAHPALQAGGLSYLAGAGRDTQAQFRAFTEALDVALTDDASRALAVSGASHVFEGFERIVRAVMSPELDGRWLTEPLNGDAGTHAVPRDLREVQAALRAGEESYRRWAYYGARYGERGLSFTRSDSCWLVALAHDGVQAALHQVSWLAGVLAARGMPSLLLEQHLELLHAELTSVVPEHAQVYDGLHAVAQALRGQRLGLLDEARAQQLARTFDVDSVQLSAREAGTLLVAAVVDEKCGRASAVESMASWFADAERFSADFRAAAQRTLAAARAAC